MHRSDLIESIRQSLDIVQIIGEVVTLKKSGSNYFGLCPFHGEKSPSFSVSPAKQLFHCFGCKEGGDVFKFVQSYYKYDFPQSVEELAKKAGIQVTGLTTQDPDWEEGNLIIETVAQSYQEALHSVGGEKFRQYLEKRRIPAAMIEQFRLGAHLGDPHQIVSVLKKKKLSEKLATQLGIIGQSRSGDSIDRFQGRLIFPIFDERGRARGFGARALGDEQPKYINSPKSRHFDKSKLLYGMQIASPAISKKDYAVLVEGYLDVMALHEFGVTNAVGVMGTALTTDQLRMLKKWCQRAVSLYDADKAGLAATERNLGLFFKEGMEAKVVILPEAKDPDAFLHGSDRSAEQLKKLLVEAFDSGVSALDYYIQRCVLSESTATARGRRLRDLVGILDQMPNEIERVFMKKDLAKRFDLPESLLIKENEPQSPKPLPVSSKPVSSDERWTKEVLKFLIQYGDKKPFDIHEILPFFEKKGVWGQILGGLAEKRLSSKEIGSLFWVGPLRSDAQQIIREWAVEPIENLDDNHLEHAWQGVLKRLKQAHFKEISLRISERLLDAEKQKDIDAIRNLLAEKRDVARLLQQPILEQSE